LLGGIPRHRKKAQAVNNHPATTRETTTQAAPTHTIVPLATADEMRERIRRKSKLKGRQPDEAALLEVRTLIGARPAEGHRRDLLIEHLHKLNDTFRCLHDRHLVALAREMNIPMAEVYEVATFYHHFEVVRGDEAAPGLTVRVCDGLACELAGAKDLLARLPELLGADSSDVRVIAAPCVGRCEQAPAVVVDRQAVPLATAAKVLQALKSDPDEATVSYFDAAQFAQKSVSPLPGAIERMPAFTDYATYRAHGGSPACAAWAAPASPPAASGASCAPSRPAPDGRQHRRRRARHLQGPRLPRARPAPLPRRHADRRLGVGIEAIYIYLRDEYHGCRACWSRSWRGCGRSASSGCRASSCAAAPAPTSAAKSPR
jgi:NADH:ubiquinone oxidoreductase subunit E